MAIETQAAQWRSRQATRMAVDAQAAKMADETQAAKMAVDAQAAKMADETRAAKMAV